ncbi:MAG: CvpA family protein [Thiotrichales bacterium]
MHWVDIVVFAIIGLSLIIGLFRGLIKEAISLATWVAAVWIALVFAAPFASLLPFQVGSQTVQNAIAFLLVFILVLIAGGIVNYLAGQLVDKTGLSGTDRMLGLVFGLARGGLLVAVLVLLAKMTNMPSEPWWQSSLTLPFFTEIANWLKDVLPPSMARHFG